MKTTFEYDGIQMKIGDVIGSEVLERHCSELSRNEYGLQSLRVQPNEWCVDLGANVGIVSIYVAQKNPSNRILAVEPVSATFCELQSNLVDNKISNVFAIEYALWKKTDEILPIAVDYLNSGGATFCRKGKTLVRTITFDDLMSRYKINELALLKIDIEGAELVLLQSDSFREMPSI